MKESIPWLTTIPLVMYGFTLLKDPSGMPYASGSSGHQLDLPLTAHVASPSM